MVSMLNSVASIERLDLSLMEGHVYLIPKNPTCNTSQLFLTNMHVVVVLLLYSCLIFTVASLICAACKLYCVWPIFVWALDVMRKWHDPPFLTGMMAMFIHYMCILCGNTIIDQRCPILWYLCPFCQYEQKVNCACGLTRLTIFLSIYYLDSCYQVIDSR